MGFQDYSADCNTIREEIEQTRRSLCKYSQHVLPRLRQRWCHYLGCQFQLGRWWSSKFLTGQLPILEGYLHQVLSRMVSISWINNLHYTYAHDSDTTCRKPWHSMSSGLCSMLGSKVHLQYAEDKKDHSVRLWRHQHRQWIYAWVQIFKHADCLSRLLFLLKRHTNSLPNRSHVLLHSVLDRQVASLPLLQAATNV